MTITEFLLARIAEDEAVAHGPAPNEWEHSFGQRFMSAESDHTEADAEFVDTFNPARVLAECAAKRRLVEWADRFLYTNDGDGDHVLRELAAVYASHPDYNQAWRA